VNTVTEADVQGIAKELILQARKDNLAAIKLLFHYVLGKPTETVNPDTLDPEEWQQMVRPIPQIRKELPEALRSLPVEAANAMVGLLQQTLCETLERPQPMFEKVTNTIATNEPERQESLEDEQGAASPEEEAPSTNGERKPAETAADPSTNGERRQKTPDGPSPIGERGQKTSNGPSPIGGPGQARRLLPGLIEMAAKARLLSPSGSPGNGKRGGR
jgi:hypothetical protein